MKKDFSWSVTSEGGRASHLLSHKEGAVKEVIAQKECSMQFWRVKWMLGSKENNFLRWHLKCTVRISFQERPRCPSCSSVAWRQLSAFQELPSHLIHSYTLPRAAHTIEVGVLRPGHFSLLLRQFSRAIFSLEFPLGLNEIVSEPAVQLNISLYPFLLSTSPSHRSWYQ